MLNWNYNKEDMETIGKIVNRYTEFHYSLGIPKQYQRPRIDLMMDIEATHCNGNPLKLQELLEADDFNFTHDMIGIQQHLDRFAGQLQDCFVPRYSA